MMDFVNSVMSWVGQNIMNTITTVAGEVDINFIGDTGLQLNQAYVDGISETSYGKRMEATWSGDNNSFLNNTKALNIKFNQFTPLDNMNSSGIYGNMVLGVPPLFTKTADPAHRTMMNTFIKDSTILSLTPGLPKYNGGQTGRFKSYLRQTEDAQAAFNYLKKNGLDNDFMNKDKRYYTFEPRYNEFYSYLETMLNTLWIKMGLAQSDNSSQFNLYSFFGMAETSTGHRMSADVKDKYNSSIGFFINPTGSVVESVDSMTAGVGLEDEVNAASDQYQRLNYLTGMGTGSAYDNFRSRVGRGVNTASQMMNAVSSAHNPSSTLNTIGSTLGKIPYVGGLLQVAASAASLGYELGINNDPNALLQAFTTTNGMKVTYPELWTNSNYSKSININFEFTSPYGDPLSIFQNVYVPFFTLLTFALPRQAADNGVISPFFVRADIPGIITSDLAMITGFNWQKGGPNNLFTKDKLPRSISGSFTISDLYPYLSMVKRISFLSANPSYTVFLDNMAGLYAMYDEEEDILDEYWERLINRVSGNSKSITGDKLLWNQMNQSDRELNKAFMSANKSSVSKYVNKKAVPWMIKR